MFDEKNDGIIGLVIGFGLGFIAAIIITKAKEAAPTTTMTQTEENREINNALLHWRPLSTIPSVDREEFQPIPLVENNTEKSTPGVTSYKNSEKWRVKRDPETGRILGYEVSRDAKIG